MVNDGNIITSVSSQADLIDLQHSICFISKECELRGNCEHLKGYRVPDKFIVIIIIRIGLLNENTHDSLQL